MVGKNFFTKNKKIDPEREGYIKDYRYRNMIGIFNQSKKEQNVGRKKVPAAGKRPKEKALRPA